MSDMNVVTQKNAASQEKNVRSYYLDRKAVLSKNKGYCKFYTPIDGYGEREWEIFTLFDKKKGWPNAK